MKRPSTGSGRPEAVEGRISYLAWDDTGTHIPSCASRFTNDASHARAANPRLQQKCSVESNMGADLEPLSMVSMHASTANHSDQGFPMPAHRIGRAVFPHPALGRVSHHGMHQRPPHRLGRDAQRLLESPEQARNAQADANLRLLDSSRHTSNQGSFPPRRLCCPSGACGTISPSDFPPGSTLMMSEACAAPPDGISPVALCAVPTCHAPYPGERIHDLGRVLAWTSAAFPIIQAGRPSRRHVRGLLRLHACCGPSAR